MTSQYHLSRLTRDGNFRAKVQALLDDVASKGEEPRIYSSIRTLGEQREKVRKGYSKTMKSYHLPDSLGFARAADIGDEKLAWGASRRFWLLVGSSAMARDLGWGGLFGLSWFAKRRVRKAILELRELGWPTKHPYYERNMFPLGWDVAHVEIKTNWKFL